MVKLSGQTAHALTRLLVDVFDWALRASNSINEKHFFSMEKIEKAIHAKNCEARIPRENRKAMIRNQFNHPLRPK